jgi:hypothetical protein
MVPIPRYIAGPCCSNADHVTNISDRDFTGEISGDMERIEETLDAFAQSCSNPSLVLSYRVVADDAAAGACCQRPYSMATCGSGPRGDRTLLSTGCSYDFGSGRARRGAATSCSKAYAPRKRCGAQPRLCCWGSGQKTGPQAELVIRSSALQNQQAPSAGKQQRMASQQRLAAQHVWLGRWEGCAPPLPWKVNLCALIVVKAEI